MLRLRSFNINLALGVIVALDAIFSLWKVLNFELKILDLVLTQDIYNVWIIIINVGPFRISHQVWTLI
jgi:hypothetical protein